MGHAERKLERLRELEILLWDRHWRVAELAKRMGVHRTLIYGYLDELGALKDDDGLYYLDRSQAISNIKVNLNEAMALYLAARRLYWQTRVCQPHVDKALQKLATALKRFNPLLERIRSTADQIKEQPQTPLLVEVLEELTKAWASNHRVKFDYQALRSSKAVTHIVSPYLIEPSPWGGDSTYLIGYSDKHEDVAVFKVERIVSKPFVISDTYEVPADFDEAEYWRYTWGIWRGEGEPQMVKLKFSPYVTRRVKESKWHPREKVENMEDGSCVWSAPIGEWREMVPWIRGWGADCEVLAPEELRKELRGEARRLATIYEWEVHRAGNTGENEHQFFDDFFAD